MTGLTGLTGFLEFVRIFWIFFGVIEVKDFEPVNPPLPPLLDFEKYLYCGNWKGDEIAEIEKSTWSAEFENWE